MAEVMVEIKGCAAGQAFAWMGEAPFQNEVFRLEWQSRQTSLGQILTVELTAKKQLTLTSLSLQLPFDLVKTDQVFLNGYQSWTDSRERSAGEKMRGLRHVPRFLLEKYAFDRYGDYGFARYPEAHGFTYCYRRRGDSYLLMASLSEREGFTVFYPDVKNRTIQVEKDCSGLELDAGQVYPAFNLAILQGREQEVFDQWFERMNIQPPAAQPLWGYTSWYQHGQNIQESLLLKTLANASDTWQVFQIDDGWEPAIGDWLEADQEKFPSGMKVLAEAIEARQLIPGLWLAPFAVQKGAALLRQHPDWVVRDEQGEPLLCGSNWGGFYALDFYHPDVQDHLRLVFSRVTREWGYRLLKLDFLYAVCIQPRPGQTRGQIMCEAMDFLRDCAGDALILGCGVPLGAAFGKVDYCRIGADVSLVYDDVPYMRLFHRERISTRNSIQNTIWRRQLSGRAFLNDPDVFLLRDQDLQLNPSQRQSLALVNALFGDLLLTSDDPSGYQDFQQKILQDVQTLRRARVKHLEQKKQFLEIAYTLDGEFYRANIDLRTGRCSLCASIT